MTAMAHEEQPYSNSSSGGGGGGDGIRSCSKKPKQKKIPQRGLGVAQLEKMRLEEQQQKAIAAPSIPFPIPSSSTDLPPSNPIFNSSIPIPSLDLFGASPPSPPPLPPPLYDHGAFHAIWNSMDFNVDGVAEVRKFEPMFQFHPSPLQNDLNPIWGSSSAVLQRKQNQPQQQQPSSMLQVNISSSSSGVNLQMEPPSNQSYCSNSIPSWPKEERMVGMKRSWPFSLDDTLQFHCKFPPFVPSYRRWDESSCGHDMFKFESANIAFRESVSSSNSIWPSNDLNPTKTGSLDGRFLTLAPPASSSNPKSKQPISVPSTHHHSEFDLLPFQGSMDYPFLQSGQQQPFYSFLPMGPSSHPQTSSDGRVEGADSVVDLNLKL